MPSTVLNCVLQHFVRRQENTVSLSSRNYQKQRYAVFNGVSALM